MSQTVCPRAGTPTQVAATAAAIRAALTDLRLPAVLTFGALVRYGAPAPHLTAAAINAAPERIAAAVGHPVRLVGVARQGSRRVVVG